MTRVLLLALSLVLCADAQFQLFSVNNGVETPVPAVLNFGSVEAGVGASIQFRLRNIFSSPASVSILALTGVGFTTKDAPQLPLSLASGAALDFNVSFQADTPGAYSAGLTLPGISVMLAATVVPSLLFRTSSPIDFGSVPSGSASIVHIAVENHGGQAVDFPALSITGGAFDIEDAPSPGTLVNSQQSTGFDIRFAPLSVGSYSGSLSAGDRTFDLRGSATDSSSQKPLISVDLPQPGSARQGTLHIAIGSVAPAPAGNASLDFQGPADPAVAFSNSARNVSFNIVPGQSIDIPFQTGTTAGALVFTVTMGSLSESRTVTIAPQPVSLSATQASRSGNSLTVQLTGYDNTRTAGPLAFDFYDRAGNPISPSPIQTSADFANFFQTSGLGGLFLVTAVFPVGGDPSGISAVDVSLTNSAGVERTGRISF